MVRVPTYENATVKPTPLRVSQDIRAPEAAFGGATAQAVSQAGQQFGQVASLLDRRAEEHAKQDAETAAFKTFTSAASEARKLMWEGDNAIYNRRGENAMGSTKEATVELEKVRKGNLDQLTSPYARQQFEQRWAQHQESELGSVSRHEAGQRREYQDQAVAGTLKVYSDQAALYYNDPAKIKEAIDLGRATINTNPQGLPPQELKARETVFTSGVHKSVVLRQMVDDPLGADKYFREHASDINADDIVTLERALKVKTTQAKGRAEAKRIEEETTVADVKTEPGQPPASRTFLAQIHHESGGRQADANGKLIVSPTGNYGISQINDASGEEAANALKIPWDPAKAHATTDEGKAYNLKLGQQYMQMKLDEWGGNETLALAAYHAGSGNVQKWIAEFGDPREGKISEAAWLAKIPGPQTRQYVTNVQATSKGERRIDLERAYTEIDKIQDPEVREQARTELDRSVADQNRVRVEKQRVARDRAQDLIVGGAHFEDIPGELLAEMDAPAQQALKTLSERIRKGEDIVSDPDTHAMLNRLAGEDVQGFAKYDLRGVRDKLSKTDMDHFEELQRQYNVAGAKGEAAATGERTRVQIATDTLRAAHIDPTPKEGSTAATQVKAFNVALDRSIRAWKVQNEGKQPTSDDIQKMADALVINGTLKGTGYVWDDEKRVFELTPEQADTFQVKDLASVPQGTLSGLRRAFKKANGRDPTDVELLVDVNEFAQTKVVR